MGRLMVTVRSRVRFRMKLCLGIELVNGLGEGYC